MSQRVLVFGGTGTIGRATVRALVDCGHEVVSFGRSKSDIPGVEVRTGDVTDPKSCLADGFCKEPFDAVVSCLASRTGSPVDAWAIDHDAHIALLESAMIAGVARFVLLSAICVQKPKLQFQRAKLAFEERLISSGLSYSIVRPTAYFKSLSGQIARVQAGKPFLLFGRGELTACKPISDRDLGSYLACCLTDAGLQNRILPIGGPGPAITPLAQGEMLFRLAGLEPKFRKVPVAMMDAIIGGLTLGGRLSSTLAAKAELARIGRYYATESMLVWDADRGRYDADATPEFGEDRLEAHYERVLSGHEKVALGDHAVF
ncbi:MAG: NAD(P)H-binding protein [Paracoccaceae bacterium]